MRTSILALIVTMLLTGSPMAQFSQGPDVVPTSAGDLTIHPVYHGSLAFTFNAMTIFVDPFGGAERYSHFDTPDLILITDIHRDHHSPETLAGLDTQNTLFVVPQAVADQMEEIPQNLLVLANGESAEVLGMQVSAIPMYNFPGDETVRHVKGRGNGYIITFGDKTVYLSGDTEDIPEMRALTGIDIAFVCMNLPFTMDIYRASDAVIEFQPAVVYPYHHRGQDIEAFRGLVDAAGLNIEVRLRDWYTE
jgi:L-ascorbate metabolism protein UlaG (beta-lactamase superfamily)